MDDASAAQAATPRSNGSPPGPGRTEASPPGTIPPGLQRKQEEPPGPALIHPDGETLAQMLEQQGRHEEAAALREDMARELAAAQARADELKRIRELLADPAAFIQALPEMFGPVLAQAFAGALQQVLQQQVVRATPHMCSDCVAAQFAWIGQNAAILEAARSAVMAQHGILDPADPRLAQIDPSPFLPPGKRPGEPDGMPVVYDAITVEGGKNVCANHHPAAPKDPAKAGRKEFLIANTALNPAMIRAAGVTPGNYAAYGIG